jgi:hypothetical protein
MDMIGEDRALGAAVPLGSTFATSESHASKQGETMTYNRMEATPRAGEHCRFWGDATAPLGKTPCCPQWICCDTAFLSFRGGGRCQVEHERFSLCYSHYEDTHGGPWQSCQQCREFWAPRDSQRYAANPINWPRY